jgi:hypothetical protein
MDELHPNPMSKTFRVPRELLLPTKPRPPLSWWRRTWNALAYSEPACRIRGAWDALCGRDQEW